MFSRLYSVSLSQGDGVLIEIETDISSIGLPSYNCVGLAESAVRESKDRVRSALRSLDYNSIFAKPITINLAPANISKKGTLYDLPIALGIIHAHEENLDKEFLSKTIIIGELSLDGKVRGLNGVLPIALCAKSNGFQNIIVPSDNLDEAILSSINVYPVSTLDECLDLLVNPTKYSPQVKSVDEILSQAVVNYDVDFEELKDQPLARRAAEISASGRHNLLMIGPPGSGKTMLAKRIPTIMPAMNFDEIIETTKIHSIAGKLSDFNVIKSRPFYAPHHTASNISIIGGGTNATPGQVSLAHNGILFLDEMLEFNRNVLEVLRQPMEDKIVTITRAKQIVTYPSDFTLISACNPCPCGYYGSDQHECSCSQQQILAYRSKLSGPLLDRIDIQIYMKNVNIKNLSNTDKKEESSAVIRKRVDTAYQIQRERYKNEKFSYNSQITEKCIPIYCVMTDDAKTILEKAMTHYKLSARAYYKVIKVARTIADLGEVDVIEKGHILEALQLRLSV